MRHLRYRLNIHVHIQGRAHDLCTQKSRLSIYNLIYQLRELGTFSCRWTARWRFALYAIVQMYLGNGVVPTDLNIAAPRSAHVCWGTTRLSCHGLDSYSYLTQGLFTPHFSRALDSNVPANLNIPVSRSHEVMPDPR